jgi:hypothetical protein
LVGSQKIWPDSVSIINTKGKGFSLLNAELWKALWIWMGPDLGKILDQNLTNLSASEDHSSQCVAMEIICGGVRAMTKYFNFDEHQQMVKFFQKIISVNLLNIAKSTDVIVDWCNAIRFIGHNQDPMRLMWLYETLTLDLLSPLKSTICQSQQIQFICAIIQQFSWRTPKLNESLLLIIKNHLSEGSAMVRKSLAELLKLLYVISCEPARGEKGQPDWTKNSTLPKPFYS